MADVIRRIGALVAAASLLAGCTGAESSIPSTAQASSTAAMPSAPTSTASTRASSVEDRVAAAMDEVLEREKYQRLIRTVEINVDGTTVFAYRRPDLSAGTTADVHSVTKSVSSALVGIAIGEGLISGVDATLAELLPQYAVAMSPEVRGTTLHQVLTHTAGFADFSDDVVDSADWVATILSGHQTSAAGHFRYSNAGSHLLSAIVATASGMPTAQYAEQKLFHPLGIGFDPLAEPLPMTLPEDEFDTAYEASAGVIWPVDPQGHVAGPGLLKLAPDHLMRLGQLYLAGGRWEGEQVVPAEWVAESTQAHVDPASGLLGYGYQWWTLTVGGRFPAYTAGGWAGQLVEVIPELDTVMVATCDDAPDAIRFPDLAELLNTYLLRELM